MFSFSCTTSHVAIVCLTVLFLQVLACDVLYEKLAVPLIADLVPRLLCTKYAALSTYVEVSSSNMFKLWSW
jgi:hypothetical protein